MEENMRARSYLSMLTLVVLVACAAEPTTVTTTTTTQEVTTTRPARELAVTRPPPPLRVETQTVTPGPGYVWTTGYSRSTATTYARLRAKWVVSPPPAAGWVAGRWVPRYNGW